MPGKLHDGTEIHIAPIHASAQVVGQTVVVQLGPITLSFRHGQLTAMHGARTGSNCLSGNEGDLPVTSFIPRKQHCVERNTLHQMLVVEMISVGVKQLDINDQVPLNVAMAIATVSG